MFGAAGRLGRTVVIEAAGRGHQVLGVVRHGAVAGVPDGVVPVEGDATDLDLVRSLAARAGVLVTTVGGLDKAVYLQVARTLVAAARELGD